MLATHHGRLGKGSTLVGRHRCTKHPSLRNLSVHLFEANWIRPTRPKFSRISSEANRRPARMITCDPRRAFTLRRAVVELIATQLCSFLVSFSSLGNRNDSKSSRVNSSDLQRISIVEVCWQVKHPSQATLEEMRTRIRQQGPTI